MLKSNQFIFASLQGITRKFCTGGGHSAHHACSTPIPDLINPSIIPSLRVQPFGCYTGTHFAVLRRMTGWVNPLVLIQWITGLELRTWGSQATTLTTKQTPGFWTTSLTSIWMTARSSGNVGLKDGTRQTDITLIEGLMIFQTVLGGFGSFYGLGTHLPYHDAYASRCR